MENATKALIMAAGVLIALVIISALLLMFNNLSNYQNTGQQNVRESQIVDFNNQFETYNRKNVRGSDLYSLIGRVIDYNRRKSTEGTGVNSEGNQDDGQYLAYEPMKLEFTITPKTLTANERVNNQLITQSKYEVSYSNSNAFKRIMDTITKIENKYGKEIIQKLCTNKDKIVINYSNNTTESKIKAIETYNSIVTKGKIDINDKSDRQIDSLYQQYWNDRVRDSIYPYYEYVQFKRARFNCTEAKYNEKTGRMISMKFEFTGKFE